MARKHNDFLLYGATGYTGELIARRAAMHGLRPLLSGRNAETVAALARELGLDHVIADVNEPKAIEAAIDSINAVGVSRPVVLNCAGPFARTADQISDACIRKNAHYLDITGEIAVFESLAQKDARAKNMDVMLLPGVGFDVVPSDCLAAYVSRRLPSATEIVIAIHAGSRISRGTALTSLENMGNGGAVRRNGRITRVPGAWKDKSVDFGSGPIRVTTMPWGDVATSWYSTGIPNIDVYMAIPTGMRRILKLGRITMPLLATATAKRLIAARILKGPPGPTAEQRERGKSRFWAEASDKSGRKFAAKLFAPEGYELTVRTAIECVSRTIRGLAKPGFQTPSRAFTPDLILSIDGVSREDLSSPTR